MRKKTKPYTEMNAKELALATREFDAPFVMEKGRPLNAAERRRHLLAAKRGRGRPRIGGGGREDQYHDRARSPESRRRHGRRARQKAIRTTRRCP